MKKISFLICLFSLISTSSLWGMSLIKGTPTPPPNIVVILADDLGWNDISMHGSLNPTPNIDKLATQGVEFKNLLVNSVCSPTRSSFYTGRDAVRNGYGGEVGSHLNPAFRTIAQSFKTAGYSTGVFGKWHNGQPDSDNPDQPAPTEVGFDTFTGFYGGGTDFYNQTRSGQKRNWYENEQHIESGKGYLTDLINDAAIKFIRKNKQQPFFCMIAHGAPHEPFQATDALLKRVPDSIRGDIELTEEYVKERSRMKNSVTDFTTFEFGGFTQAERRVVYAAMVIGLDDAVGQVLKELETAGIRDNTIVLFFSDNGAMRFIREGNLPLRNWKHDMYEGAVHVPGILSWPNGPNGTTYESLIRGVDLYPTLASMAKVKIEDKKTLDGTNHFDAIKGTSNVPDVEWNGIFVYYGAFRNNQWKLIVRAKECELYNIQEDISESKNLAAKHPDIVEKLLKRHREWLKDTGANVNYTSPQLLEIPEPAPQGDVLEVKAKQGKWLVDIPMPSDLASEPGDCLAYDMKILQMQPGQAVYISTTRGDATIFQGEGGIGVNIDGTILSSTEKPPAPVGEWRRYVAGIGNLAAMRYRKLRLAVQNNKPQELSVQIDNIHILKADGSTIPVWDGGPVPGPAKKGLTLNVTPEN